MRGGEKLNKDISKFQIFFSQLFLREISERIFATSIIRAVDRLLFINKFLHNNSLNNV